MAKSKEYQRAYRARKKAEKLAREGAASRTFSYGGVTNEAAADYSVRYTGTEQELTQADYITAVHLSKTIDKATPIVGAVGDVFSGIGYYSTNQNAQRWATEISDAGYSKDEKGAMQYFVDRSNVLQDIKNISTAKEVIDKYGDVIGKRKVTRTLRLNGEYNWNKMVVI